MISIAITTRNRPNEFKKVVESIEKFTNCDYQLIVVDDASDNIYCDASYRFEERAGIPAVKNKCLELSKFDHIFLFDDDTYPISYNWWKPYVTSGKNHLCYTFLPHYKSVNGFNYHQLSNGCMMYVTRKCIEKIGGFDWGFGLGKYEHVNLSRRIFNSGLTEHPFMDLVGSERLLYCLDQEKDFKRSFNDVEMQELLQKGRSYHQSNMHSKEYIDYIK